MDQKARRAAIMKALKAGGLKARKGHLRLGVGELFWYVDVQADGPTPTAALRLEVGCWLPSLTPEPEGGAVDCPLLADVPVGDDPAASAGGLVDLIAPVGSVGALRGLLADGRLPGALVDRDLRALIEG